jgi:hypothetical protein
MQKKRLVKRSAQLVSLYFYLIRVQKSSSGKVVSGCSCFGLNCVEVSRASLSWGDN